MKRGIIVFSMTGPSTDAGAEAGTSSCAGAIRPPAFAGLFYPDDADGCRKLAQQYVSSGKVKVQRAVNRRKWCGGIVPHAGWICSGAVAGETIGAIAAAPSAGQSPDVLVVFGAVHTPAPLENATLDTFAQWSVPGVTSRVSHELRAKLIEQGREMFRADDRFHRREHAVEVELPLIQAALNLHNHAGDHCRIPAGRPAGPPGSGSPASKIGRVPTGRPDPAVQSPTTGSGTRRSNRVSVRRQARSRCSAANESVGPAMCHTVSWPSLSRCSVASSAPCAWSVSTVG